MIFIDSGGWIALLNRTERLHPAARDYYAERVAERERFLTTNYVVDETATRLRYDAGLEAALSFRAALERAVRARRLRVAWIDTRLEREGWGILQRYADIDLSLTDATSVVVARRAKVREVFGFDRDFLALGFDLQPAV